jgi:putative hydrolase of the HAD superfamily
LNIVFDLGGVVFEWRPDKIIHHVFHDEPTRALVKSEIFEHRDWVELDRGTISLQQAIDNGTSRTGLPRDDIERLLNAVPHFLVPIQDTIEMIRDIRESNNKFFVLSNMHIASIAHLEKKHKIWDMFDGIVISSRINKVKPEFEIYEHLLTTYELNAADTVFIDDMNENLAAASRLGIQTIRFVDADQCRQDLMGLGCV